MVRLRTTWVALLVFLLVTGVAAAQPFRTGFLDPTTFSSPKGDTAFAEAAASGASLVRIPLTWNVVAPTEPADPTNPSDPAYQWTSFDKQIIQAVKHGLDPILEISGAPNWARGTAVGLPGTWPSPAKFGQIAHAAAVRYDGTFRPESGADLLPRVRYWQAWNEPNTNREISPQRRNGKPVTPGEYRLLLNRFADSVHAVHANNLVVAGGLDPFGHESSDIQVVAPIVFMSQLLCVSSSPPYHRTCSSRAHFDIWSHNPYTNGGPDFHAHSPNDVSLGDLPKMHNLLVGAYRAGAIVSTQKPPQFWVTEFSWDTNPPDPRGVPMALHARWVAEALYRMWQAGVSAAVWFRLRDDPLSTSPYQSGFYTVRGAAKPSLRAFRFPFVAFPAGSKVQIWGRTPTNAAGAVTVEAESGARWTVVSRLRAGSGGVFSMLVSKPAGQDLRAHFGNDISVPFSLTPPPGFAITSPFGCGGPIRC